ncbi:hypothetical protein TSOC_009048 [Tetrabaena socialis]|uniref:Pherophorin domain-containing protein n=1 Tax=Tetrabaena socialis TaxID=47790 RepID=A0A2J7ZWT3_9CHLO|nr:hypothetical protein TSOC_009048 [Tetrabaena socialis]|eukprot:PNH04724.1 hypothetical protein TSOC_009048 [Tetrabaena socialis]
MTLLLASRASILTLLIGQIALAAPILLPSSGADGFPYTACPGGGNGCRDVPLELRLLPQGAASDSGFVSSCLELRRKEGWSCGVAGGACECASLLTGGVRQLRLRTERGCGASIGWFTVDGARFNTLAHNPSTGGGSTTNADAATLDDTVLLPLDGLLDEAALTRGVTICLESHRTADCLSAERMFGGAENPEGLAYSLVSTSGACCPGCGVAAPLRAATARALLAAEDSTGATQRKRNSSSPAAGTNDILSPPIGPPTPQCKRGTANTPYNLSYVPQADPTLHCFRVSVHSCDPANSCCSMDLYKVLFRSVGACRKSVSNTTVDGNPRSITWENDDYKGETQSSFKFTQLLRTVGTADGTTLCFNLQREGECTTLRDLCGGDSCTIATAERNSGGCCPVQQIPLNPFAPAAPAPSSPAVNGAEGAAAGGQRRRLRGAA